MSFGPQTITAPADQTPSVRASPDVQRLEVIAAGSLAAAVAAFRNANELAAVAERDELNLRLARMRDLDQRLAEAIAS